VGGAWAFDSEASAGDTVPTLDSIERFMSPFEQAQLWQSPDYNQFHLNYENALPAPSNFGYAFGTLHDFDNALKARYGPWSSLASYVEEAQLQDYETQRAQFEAYIDHSTRSKAPSTGVVYWQLNKGWPTLLWDLYNYDYDEAGSYFGAKKANEPLHALYAYDDGTVALDNLGSATQRHLSVEANVYAIDGKLVNRKTRGGIKLTGQAVLTNVLRPTVPRATNPSTPAQTYFVELLLRHAGKLVNRNVYWFSTQRDLVNWKKTLGQPQASMKQFADFGALRNLPTARISVTAHTHPQPGTDGATDVTELTITNISSTKTVALFLRSDIRRGTGTGALAPGDNQVLPVVWSDNDTTLWPGESETLRATYRASDLDGQSPVATVFGWNVASVAVGAT
jgi:exo-1,4-beta-D-glucosaminidase